MEIKRPIGAVLGATAAAATLLADANALQYTVCADNTVNPIVPILGPIPYGRTRRLSWEVSQAEVRQIAAIGAVTVPEVITASTRYRIEIGNVEKKYETTYPGRTVFSYTSPAVLSGVPATDRANVNTVLVGKINAQPGIDVVASTLHSWAYTIGGVAAPVAGELMTQAASGVTMIVIGHTVTAGTFAGGNAVGLIHVAFVSNPATLDVAVARILTGGTSGCTLTPTTGAPMVAGLNQGIAIRDNAGYFISRAGRRGISQIQATQGFTTTSFTVAVAGVYSRGIGATLLQLSTTRYDHSNQELLSGDIDFELIRGQAFVAGINYRKYIIEVEDGDFDTKALQPATTITRYFLWVDEAAAGLVAFHNALVAAVAL